MGIRSWMVLVTVGLLACGESTSEPSAGQNSTEALSEANQQRRARILAMRGKADLPQAKTSDVCEYYDLYDDGVCDTQCEETDADCDGGTDSLDDGLAWLCELEVRESNSICLDFCGTADPDCDEAALREDAEQACADTVDNTDGKCNAECFPEDHDCVAKDDACLDELRYGDGICDDDCGFIDPDCDPDSVSDTLLSSEEKSICSGFPEDGELRRDLATSICMGRAAADVPTCVVACAQQ